MKAGDCIHASTHADLLNQILRKNYKAYMKSGYNLPDGKIIWMIALGPFITPSGWINELVSIDRVSERHIGLDFDFQHNTYINSLTTGYYFSDADRVIFEVVKTRLGRKYIFRGVFRLNKEKSSINENVWDRVLDEYCFC